MWNIVKINFSTLESQIYMSLLSLPCQTSKRRNHCSSCRDPFSCNRAKNVSQNRRRTPRGDGRFIDQTDSSQFCFQGNHAKKRDPFEQSSWRRISFKTKKSNTDQRLLKPDIKKLIFPIEEIILGNLMSNNSSN